MSGNAWPLRACTAGEQAGEQKGVVTAMMTTPPSHRVIAIDGPSGVGKSTVAKRLARRLDYCYVDSGAMYRAVGWAVHTAAIPFDATPAIVELAQRTHIELTFDDGQAEVWVNRQRITPYLQGENVGAAASAVALVPAVRDVLTTQLRRMRCQGSVVMEGRDIGTVVFPDAAVKFFLDASLEQRAQRRWDELRRAGHQVKLACVQHAVARRDAQDRSRAVASLRPAAEAHVIDTTDLTIDDVVKLMLSDIHP